ncbi:MAG: winged helix DNA-binding protein [Candidatus Nanopelagicales bacterium]|jgi:DNA-binding MarR family transcriptional regulator|nr:winged helix DNA-binding protein [Candidatus Nanopelagicales bacterium]
MSDDDQNTGLLLFYPYRAMEARVLARVRAAGYDVTTAQARIFARIGPTGTRLSDLAAQAQVTKATAGFIVDHLERAELVTRVPDPDDGRARLVTITDKGQHAVQLATDEVAAVEQEWTAHLGARRMRQLRQALTQLREITDPWAERSQHPTASRPDHQR